MSPLPPLLRWYARNKRDLPWRNTRDPYKIFVSEMMLQQTQVDRVTNFYVRWIKRFPDWRSLARASTKNLLDAWAGLGYNRRALMLRDAARDVVRHGVPKTMDEWRRLKGIGPYTAAAIHAITARKRVIVIDTNVRRVAGRVFRGIPYPALADDPAVKRALDRRIPRKDAFWEIPQALMDLGTAVCTPRDPDCAHCPLRNDCRAAPKFLKGRAGPKPKTAVREHRHRDKPHPDRIYRGRILAAVRTGRARTIRALGPIVDASYDAKKDATWMRAMVSRLTKDGFLTITRGEIFVA